MVKGEEEEVEAPHPAEDGHQVVLTHGEHVDVFDDHHLVVVLVKDGVVHHICRDTNIRRLHSQEIKASRK